MRSKAAGLGTMANWTFNFIVSLTFLLLIEAARPAAAPSSSTARSASSPSGFCWKLVPETKGKRLEDIQAYFQAQRRSAPHERGTGCSRPCSASGVGLATLPGCA